MDAIEEAERQRTEPCSPPAGGVWRVTATSGDLLLGWAAAVHMHQEGSRDGRPDATPGDRRTTGAVR